MMEPTRWFAGAFALRTPLDDYLVLLLLCIGGVLGVLLFIERPRHEPMNYSPKMAWLRAGLYFVFVLIFASVNGVLAVIMHTPLISGGQTSDPLWLGMAGLCVAVTLWGYVFWWPRGTLTHGRKLHLIPALFHGTLWGVCAGLVALSIYALLEPLGWPGWATAIGVLPFLTVYSLNYQSGWWDIHVSPPHNIRAWNNKKVAGAHNPFLFVTLAFFTVHGNAALYVAFSAFAMAASSVAMKFPAYWDPDGDPVSLETALGE